MLTYSQTNPNPKLVITDQIKSIRFIKDPIFNQVKLTITQDNKFLKFNYDSRFCPDLKLTDSCYIEINTGSRTDLIDFVIIQTNPRHIPNLKTYVKQIDNKIKDCFYGVKLTMKIYFKHFPFKVTKQTFQDKQRLRIINYLGYKSDILVTYKNITVNLDPDQTAKQNKTFQISNYDRITLGNFANVLENIRKTTKLRKLDPRKFTDGIYKFVKS